MTVWVVLASYNDYDQHGSYFCCWYPERPDSEMLLATGFSAKDAEHISKGGGRREFENVWYTLQQVGPGVDYHHERPPCT
jgi:hypothetical protein